MKLKFQFYHNFLNLINMKKITLIVLLLIFQFSIFAQDITSTVLSNADFEDESGYDTGWTLKIKEGDTGVATMSDATSADANSGDHAAKVEVTTTTQINHMYLTRTLNTTGLAGEKIRLTYFAKKQGGNGKVMMYINSEGSEQVSDPASANLVPGGWLDGKQQHPVNPNYQDWWVDITVPDGADELVLEIWLGATDGSYFFDDFKVENTAALSINSYEVSSSLKMYPNPTNDILNFDTSYQIENIEIINSLGKNVKSFSNQRKININTLNSGVYFAKINFENNMYIHRKLIKK